MKYFVIHLAAFVYFSCVTIYKSGKLTSEELKAIEATSLNCSYLIYAKVEYYYRNKGVDFRNEDKPKEYEQKLELMEAFKADLISKHKISENRIFIKYEDFEKVKGCKIDVFIQKRIVDPYLERGVRSPLPGEYTIEFSTNAILENSTPKCSIEYSGETRFLNLYHLLTFFTFFLFQDLNYQEKIISYHDKLMHRDLEAKMKKTCNSG
ncbi:hypothetical protein [Leptospira sp. id769339]|uniref:hypothetical protein n=1 Tax=Leptospira sp. id769339 TaxID=2864221 RepID=UPI00214B5D7A|nr:hypothetical protein [Leptospira sp. id769339]MCR1795538.1 hypothetical protein [Leptospira sp. id769339]